MVDQNKKEYKNFGFGLKKLPPDKRDVAFGSLFGLPDLSELPRDYFIPSLEIKNQFNSDLCAAFAATAIAEFQDEVLLSPYYTFVKGQYDLFDNIRATIWANKEKKQGVITGCLWRSIWTRANDGIIPKFDLDKEGFGHAFVIAGWKEINGETYLIAQLSNGIEVGDKGYFYFPRNV